MKQEYTLIKEKCNKMVTNAMSPSHHLRSEDSEKSQSISFLTHSCSTNYVVVSIINLLLCHIAYPFTLGFIFSRRPTSFRNDWKNCNFGQNV